MIFKLFVQFGFSITERLTAQRKQYQQQQASAPSSIASSGSSTGSQAAITPAPPPPSPTPPPQPPKESFARRYKFLWPLLLAVNFTVGGLFRCLYLYIYVSCICRQTLSLNVESCVLRWLRLMNVSFLLGSLGNDYLFWGFHIFPIFAFSIRYCFWDSYLKISFRIWEISVTALIPT